MLKSYKFRIYPNNQQKVLIEKTFGCCRWVYNWALNFKTKRYKDHKDNINRFELSKFITFFKSTEERSWLKEVNAQSLQAELRHLESAFTNFFKKQLSYPKFKKKNQKQSYECPQYVWINFNKKFIKLPVIGHIKYRDNRMFNGKVKTSTVSRNCCGQYFVSILVDDSKELPKKKIIEENTSVGIDVGIRTFATMSNDTKIDNPKFAEKQNEKLKNYKENYLEST